MKQYRAALFVFVVPAVLAVAGVVQLVREDRSGVAQARFVPMAVDEHLRAQPPLEAVRALLRRPEVDPDDPATARAALQPARRAAPLEADLARRD
jgi:hypothetical protein